MLVPEKLSKLLQEKKFIDVRCMHARAMQFYVNQLKLQPRI